ncbi:hypothetical protein [Alcaligenes faecalis]|uniref:hypothetical protein n=1 Tax=Alcaligenes faecalis TaxID=511 RepID=UPI001C838B61|nr:hypothetical protein [Alcaligenes faecalis]MBX6964696.1 hypothetical protein [Providencia rettgeri]MBX7033014.1 hypothetical protein [Alcaligenes faecalis]
MIGWPFIYDFYDFVEVILFIMAMLCWLCSKNINACCQGDFGFETRLLQPGLLKRVVVLLREDPAWRFRPAALSESKNR